ncbi:D-alanine--D-alanine ligase [Oceanirhabdus sp. W0125-5]|uniref:D-alanine--D-alanine ligase n=1 Tax=Oceanirhabdus sp. W0125-5 TaxID=2999116 RepID=UPI0022F33F8F|nr:D-alanine--D-alanine ligase [Oceanirhabdus sp. W0125-5]WBW99648.1 D-alanine--D-alanine ligase [Oceanirhabdus sp. W0125-5]
MNKVRVGILMGGISSEREVSLMTGREIIKKINKEKYVIEEIILNNKNEVFEKVRDIDLAFIALHGEFGEDGTIQGALEVMGIPYTGTGVLGSVLCMNKQLCKNVMNDIGILTPKWIEVNGITEKREENNELTIGIDYFTRIMIRLEKAQIKAPLVIKPASGGSSLGISIINDYSELNEGICKALTYDKNIIIEEFIQGDELTVSILEGKVLPIVKIQPEHKWFDYTSKYKSDKTIEHVIKLPEQLEKKIKNISKKCWEKFKLDVYGRIDVIIKKDDVYVLEINTLPGLTEKSLFPISAKEVGISYEELLDEIIVVSLNKRFRR